MGLSDYTNPRTAGSIYHHPLNMTKTIMGAGHGRKEGIFVLMRNTFAFYSVEYRKADRYLKHRTERPSIAACFEVFILIGFIFTARMRKRSHARLTDAGIEQKPHL